MGKDIVILTIQNGMNNQHELHRLKKGSFLRFKIGHTLCGKHLRIFTNYPVQHEKFIRNKYIELDIINPTPSNNIFDCFDNYCELKAVVSGAYQFYFTEDETDNISNKIGEGYFIVDPRFSFSNANGTVNFELDGLILQTYLAKNLGSFNNWQKKLDVAVHCKYNMIHFTPLQELGYSQSAYSLKDQLKVNPAYNYDKTVVNWDDVEKLVHNLHEKHNILSMTDLVYNHSSNDSPWIHEHPECSYNVVNSPHLRPAYLIDRVIWNLTEDVSANVYQSSHGLDSHVNHNSQLEIVKSILWDHLRSLNIHEFYLAHVDNQKKQFRQYLSQNQDKVFEKHEKLKLIHNNYRRLESTVDFEIAATLFFKEFKDFDLAVNKLGEVLCGFNDKKFQEINSHLEMAVTNVMANISYRFLEEHGLKLNKVTADTPLMWHYFYHPVESAKLLSECEKLMDSGEQRIMAFNGWVMGDDPLRNFAEESSNVYLRRELIVWGDSVKLRYGQSYEDCPYLWDRMFEYTAITAKIFDGVRLDNCHSTPIHVAQAMMDKARSIRPDIYVAAELFTGNEGLDNIFVNKLGLNSLIREEQAAWNCKEQGRLIYRYGGGLPTGSFMQVSEGRKLHPTTAHALLYDMTHDNQSPVQTRSPFDLIPSAAMACSSVCAVGSTRGYDEVVPHYIDVVNETRLYADYDAKQLGLYKVRAFLNDLHQQLARQHYTELFVDQLDDEVVAITRHSPSLRKSTVIVCHSAFRYPGHCPPHRYINTLRLSGQVVNIAGEICTCRDINLVDAFKKSPDIINGLPGVWAELTENVPIESSHMLNICRDENTGQHLVEFKFFPPGSVVVLEVDMILDQLEKVKEVQMLMAQEFNSRVRSGSSGHCLVVNELMLDEQMNKSSTPSNTGSLHRLLADLSLSDLCRLMYRSHEEELAETQGKFGAYDIPDYGKLVFCGLQGLISELEVIRQYNDLGHPICGNLRAGNWLIDYICDRLIYRGGNLAKIGIWMRSGLLGAIGELPRFWIPAHFDMALVSIHATVLHEMYYRLGDTVVFGSSLVKSLAVNSVMLCSNILHTNLPPISPTLEIKEDTRVSLSAGLPHFAEGIWRNWGRDTFIALPGLLLFSQRFDDAAQIILTYASTMRHGLIPNLLGDGLVSRYNARDATWFWLHAIKQYELSIKSPDQSILKAPVVRMYPMDDSTGYPDQYVEQPLYQVIQECLQLQANGIDFIERNAGPEIDEHMTPEGFHIVAGIRNSNKFPYGGNSHNCGTWMDKMGSSFHAGNKGKPATPRDGSPIEIVGLCAAVMEWLTDFHNKKVYPYDGVTFNNAKLTWRQWFNDIKEYFDDMFFIPLDCEDKSIKHNCGIYRDTVNSQLGYPDAQFRPNFLVAMTLAPYLFDVEHAWHALTLVQKELLGKLGMRTLSPKDWAYRGYYDNSNDSCDATIANGFNYHQGPEWLWLTGYYLRAKLIFAKRKSYDTLENNNTNKDSAYLSETIKHVQEILGRLHHHIHTDKWRSLPELTQKDGEFCPHSCTAQSWSVATTLEAIDELFNLHTD